MLQTGRRTRFFYLDILKIIAIFLVIFCHYQTVGNTILDNMAMTICYIAVPVFFMVNGALLFNKSFDLKKHIKKTITLYVCSWVWKLVYLLDAIFVRKVIDADVLTESEIIKYFLFGQSIGSLTVGLIWFIHALVAIYIIFPALYFCKKDDQQGKKVLWLIVIALLVLNYAVFDIGTILACFDITEYDMTFLNRLSPINGNENIANMLACFIVGGLLHDERFNQSDKTLLKRITTNKIMPVIAFCVGYVLMMLQKYVYDGVWQWNGVRYQYGYQHLAVFISAVALFIFFLAFEFNDERCVLLKKFLSSIAGRTLGIFYVHWIVCMHLEAYFTDFSFYGNMVRTSIILVIAYVISYVLSKIPCIKKLVS